MNRLMEAAEKFLGIGLCPLPADLTKKHPIGKWREFQTTPPSIGQLSAWFSEVAATALCIVTGKVSGNLELIDFDLLARLFAPWREIVDAKAPGLVDRLLIERSQSGGKHVVYRCEGEVEGNQKLAEYEWEVPTKDHFFYSGKKITPRRKGKAWLATITFIETRGEGGVFLCAPSPGYELEQGSYENIPVITAEERAILLEAARSLNVKCESEVKSGLPLRAPSGFRPGDDYNLRGDVRALLLNYEWRPCGFSEGELFQRPGKEGEGCSASLKDRVFYVHSTNASPFTAGKGHSPFEVYTLLEHDGDFSAAAKQLAKEGYGDQTLVPSNLGAASTSATLAKRDSESGKWILSPKQNLPIAEAYLADFHSHPDGCTLVHYAGTFLEWRDNRYVELEENELRKRLQRWLHDCLQYGRGFELKRFDANTQTINQAIDGIRAYVHLAATTATPSWLGNSLNRMEPKDLLPCKSSLFYLPSETHLPPTPNYFTRCALDFDPDPSAAEPMAWHEFMHQLFDGDWEALDLLQEWFGYALTGDTSQQKMLLMIGPKRSGKGTIARVLTELIGRGNVCGPTVSSLAEQFGLQPLIGKSLAIVSDARFHGDNMTTVAERLLCISGEDGVSIPRKFKESLNLKLPTRFMFLTNELPRISDPSKALAGRFVMIKLQESFYGKEDTNLTQKLLSELPGILNWAIEGWQRLRERGHFLMPGSVREMVQEIEDLSSPISGFIRERCTVKPGHRVTIEEIYNAWLEDCRIEGRQFTGDRQWFGRQLAAVVPHVTIHRKSRHVRFYEGIGLRPDFEC